MKLNLQTHLHSVEDDTQPSASYVFNGSVDVYFQSESESADAFAQCLRQFQYGVRNLTG